MEQPLEMTIAELEQAISGLEIGAAGAKVLMIALNGFHERIARLEALHVAHMDMLKQVSEVLKRHGQTLDALAGGVKPPILN